MSSTIYAPSIYSQTCYIRQTTTSKQGGTHTLTHYTQTISYITLFLKEINQLKHWKLPRDPRCPFTLFFWNRYWRSSIPMTRSILTSCSFLLRQFGAVCGKRLSCNFLRQVIVSLPTKFLETHGHFHFITSYEPNRNGPKDSSTHC